MNTGVTVRPAEDADVEAIFTLLEMYSGTGVVLPRSREDIREHLGNFRVAITERGTAGCAAVRDFGGELLEVRSLVVHPERQGSGIGKTIVGAIIDELRRTRKEWRLFALTKRPEFFAGMGFREVPKALFPEKIWSDCVKCSKRHCCDETAMLLDSAEGNDGMGN